jgi:VWFA-related protein
MVKYKFILYSLVINLTILFLSQYALAQKKEQTQQLTYEVVVRVTKIDVIVTDKQGKRVTGLIPDNFKIYEDGKLQRLTNFYEVKGMEVYASAPHKKGGTPSVPDVPIPKSTAQIRNKIIIYFDNWQLHPLNRNWSINKIVSFIKRNFPPDSNNDGMVVCLDQKLQILQTFTSNQRLLTLAVEEVKNRSGQSLMRRRQRQELRGELNRTLSGHSIFDKSSKYDSYMMALSQARNFVESEQNDLIFSLKSLTAFMNNLTGIEGKKILIYVSDGLPINPGEEVFSFLDQAFPRTNARNEAMNYDATRFFKELTARCNANEITLYTINAQGLEHMILSADQQAGWDVRKQGSGMVNPGTRSRNEALKLMAADTGGVAILNTNNIESGLKKIENDLQFYYTLGYESLHRGDNKYHSIKVKLDGVNGKYTIRVKQGFKHISREENIKEKVFSGLFLKHLHNPLGIMVQILPVKRMLGSKQLRLTMKFLIPIKNIALIPGEKDYFGQFKVYIVLKDSAGRISPCHELTEDIKIPVKDYQVALQSRYPYLAEMYVNPGSYTISFALRDMKADTTNYLQIERRIAVQ